jgi:putative ABC transport system permease protein
MNRKWLQFAWRNTLRNRRRSLVTVSIAALGTAAMLLAGGFALFTYEGLAQSSARNTGHLIIAKPAQFTQEEDTPLQHGLENAQALRKQLLARDDVRQVLPRVEFSGLLSNGDKSTVIMAAGIDPDAEFAIKGPFLTITAGKPMRNGQVATVMLGSGLARNLKAVPGTSLTLLASTTDGVLNALDVTVEGVFSTGIAEMDKRLVYTDVATAQKLLNTQRVTKLGVFLNRMEATAPAQAEVQAMLPQLTTRTWEDEAAFYRGVKALYDRIFGALGAIIATIVLFVVANAMAMTVIERTREIGTLRAMGTLPAQLIRSFGLEGLMLGGLGALVGALTALGVSLFLLAVEVRMPPPPGYNVGYPLKIAISAPMYAGVLITMLLLSALASAWVARRTVAKPITEALAHV